MPLSSEINSVDTLQVLPACDAFTSGRLLVSEYRPSKTDMFQVDTVFVNRATESSVTGLKEIDNFPDGWESSPVNGGLMAVASVILVLYIRKFVTVFPYLVGGVFRWKRLAELENNMRLSRERDAVVLPSFIILCLGLSRLAVLSPAFIQPFSPSMRTAVTFGICMVFLIFRKIMILLVPHGKIRRDALLSAAGAGNDFLILTAGVFTVLVIISGISAGCYDFARNVSCYSICAIWGLFLFRKGQIMGGNAGQLQAILYLCAVEVLPAVLLVASMMIL